MSKPKKPTYALLGSAPDVEGALKLARRFFVSDNVTLHPTDDSTVQRVHTLRGATGTVVRQKGKRYRFEREEEGV